MLRTALIIFLLFNFLTTIVKADYQWLKTTAEAYRQSLQQQSRQLKSETLSQSQLQQLSQSAAVLYQQKDCYLASEVFLKQLLYQGSINPHQWYRLSLYLSCANRADDASRAIFLAYQLEENPQQKHQYQMMLANYLFEINQHNSSWYKDLTVIFNELTKNRTKPNQRLEKNYQQLLQLQQQAGELVFSSIESRSGKLGARICWTTTIEQYIQLTSSEMASIKDYIRISPSVNYSIDVDYQQFCLSGLKYRSDYQIELLKGLKIKDKTLNQKQSFTIKTLAQPSSFWFKQQQYILPAENVPNIPIYSINTEGLFLSLYHIAEEHLSDRLFIEHFKNNINNYSLNEIKHYLANQVWQAKIELNPGQDQTIKTMIPLQQSWIHNKGVYLLLASDKEKTSEYYQQYQAQWLVVSDIGLTSYQHKEGMLGIAHSLHNGQSLADLEVKVFSSNNTQLAVHKTDTDGVFHLQRSLFDKDNDNRASYLIVKGDKSGFLYFPLNQTSYDLSDRGVGGRLWPGSLDAYLFSERGIYRPGEKIHLTALLRDQNIAPVDGLPLTLKVFNPQSQRVQELIVKAQNSAYLMDYEFSSMARTGLWQFKLYADKKAQAIAELSVKLEAIKPPDFKVRLTTEKAVLSDKSNQFKVQADYLFGAPAAQLALTLDYQYKTINQPFDKYKNYFFGLSSQAQEQIKQDLSSFNSKISDKTDTKGHFTNEYQIPDSLPKIPLQLTTKASVVNHDGVMVSDSNHILIQHLPLYIGLKPSFKQSAPANQAIGFELLTLNQQLEKLENTPIAWKLYRETHDFQWFSLQDKWHYEKISSDKLINQAKLITDNSAKAALNFSLDDGSYRLELIEEQREVSTVYHFTVGEQVHSSSNFPDMVKLSLDKSHYQSGESAQLTIESPYSGIADILLVDHNIEKILTQELSDKISKISIPLNRELGSGAYILVSVYPDSNKISNSTTQSPRAMGIIWLGSDKKPYTLPIQIDYDKTIKAGERLQIKLSVDGIIEDTQVMLMAVDEAVLNMTHYKTPDPLEYFYGKKQFASKIMDNYAKLIDTQGQVGKLKFGGDRMLEKAAFSDAFMPQTNIRIVSLYKNPQALEKGSTIFELQLPEFNGRLRLMAVAWTNNKMGAVEEDLVLADDVVAIPALPRFLAPQDSFVLNLPIHNIKGSAGEYRFKLSANDKLDIVSKNPESIHLAEKGQALLQYEIKANTVGSGVIQLTIQGPDNFQLKKSYDISIRYASLPLLQHTFSQLQPNQEYLIDNTEMDQFVESTASKKLAINSHGALNIDDLLKQLDQYPYGCLEQIVSRASPFLNADLLTEKWQYQFPLNPRIAVNKAIQKVIEKQKQDGRFGLWSADDSSEQWLTMYSMEFLLNARKQGYIIADYFINKGLNSIRTYINQQRDFTNPEVLSNLAYAHYILVLSAQPQREQLRYLAKQFFDKMPDLFSMAVIIRALYDMGEIEMAAAYAEKIKPANIKRQLNWQDYGSRLRDMAAFAYRIKDIAPAQYQQAIRWINSYFTQKHKKPSDLSTQEMKWLVNYSLTLEKPSELTIKLEENLLKEKDNSLSLEFTSQQLTKSKLLYNSGESTVWLSDKIQGVPKQLKSLSEGMTIEKTVTTLDGQAVDLKQLRHGQEYYVLISGQASSGLFHRAIIADLLPAGLAITQTDNQDMPFSQNNQSEVRYVRALDDRLIVAIDIPEGKQQKFAFVYKVRAQTPGDFIVPAAMIHDMYQTFYRANNAAGQIHISSN